MAGDKNTVKNDVTIYACIRRAIDQIKNKFDSLSGRGFGYVHTASDAYELGTPLKILLHRYLPVPRKNQKQKKVAYHFFLMDMTSPIE